MELDKWQELKEVLRKTRCKIDGPRELLKEDLPDGDLGRLGSLRRKVAGSGERYARYAIPKIVGIDREALEREIRAGLGADVGAGIG